MTAYVGSGNADRLIISRLFRGFGERVAANSRCRAFFFSIASFTKKSGLRISYALYPADHGIRLYWLVISFKIFQELEFESSMVAVFHCHTDSNLGNGGRVLVGKHIHVSRVLFFMDIGKDTQNTGFL